MQVACRGGWPPGVDGSTRPLQWMCLLVVMMGGAERLSAGLCWAVKFRL